MAINQNISAFPTAPNSTTDTPTEFNAKADAYVNHQSNVFTDEVNQWAIEANALAASIDDIVATLPEGFIDDITPSLLNAYSSQNIENNFLSLGGGELNGDLVLTSNNGAMALNKPVGETTQVQLDFMQNALLRWRLACDSTNNFTLNSYDDTGAYIGTALSIEKNTTVLNFLEMPKVANDPIIETGSDANGQWTKFSDGTMIYEHNASLPDCSAAAGAIFASSATIVWNFTIPFVGDAPKVSGNNVGSTVLWVTANPSLASAEIRGISYVSISSARNINLIAIGRWK